ncbi:MAG: helix-hairpin-helix domain-containing protein [Anaerolineae bacterium]
MSRRIRLIVVLVLLPVLGLLALLLWWWLRRHPKEEMVLTYEAETAVLERATEIPAPMPAAEPLPPDDLKRIEGIGPKISSALQAAGITTYAQLAATEVSRLEEIIRQAGIRIGFPGTWPEQASLAAAGQWAELKALQSELKGGRRV